MPPVKYAPGSFSKNFAWHGTGLRKLHAAIRSGFHNTLSPIGRQTLRSAAGVKDDIVRIPINFFLHNRNGYISVDELVFQAVERGHSIRFDRLALFALNLSRVGSGRDARSGREINSRPAMWANEFVREKLWSRGTWQANALQDASLDPFLTDRMAAQADVRVKCRNNYRHMFQLCRYWPAALPAINSGSRGLDSIRIVPGVGQARPRRWRARQGAFAWFARLRRNLQTAGCKSRLCTGTGTAAT